MWLLLLVFVYSMHGLFESTDFLRSEGGHLVLLSVVRYTTIYTTAYHIIIVYWWYQVCFFVLPMIE